MRSLMWPIAASVALAFSTPPLTFAQAAPTKAAIPQSAEDGQSDSETKHGSDEAFVKEAARRGLAEITLGNLARDRAGDPKIKALGQRMVADHANANAELRRLAVRKNIALATELDSKRQAGYDRLSKLTGAAFDQAYVSTMLDDHEADVTAFFEESRDGKDSEVRAWAAKMLPTLREHLTAIEEAHRTIDGKRSTGH